MKRYLYSTLIALLHIVAVYARPVDLHIREIGVGDGLSQSDVICMHQDIDGQMWISTNAGLNIYDGLEFEQMDVDRSYRVHAPNYRHLCEDIHGNMWICVTDNIVIYNKERNESYLLRDIFTEKRLSYPRVAFEHNGDAVVHTGREIHLFDGSQSHYSYKKSIEMEGVVDCVMALSSGRTLVATSRGAAMLEDGEVTMISERRFLRFCRVNRVVYALAEDGLYIFRDGEFEWYNSMRLTNLVATDRLCWVATGANRLSVVEIDSNGFILDSEPQVVIDGLKILSMTTDRNRQVWVGTNDGLKIINTRSMLFGSVNYDRDIFSNNVRSIHEDSDNNLWVGSHRGNAGLIFVTKGNYEEAVSVPLPARVDDVHSICSIGRNVYVASDQMFEVRWNGSYKEPKFKSRLIENPGVKNNIMVCRPDPSGDSLWIGYFNEGIYRYHIATGRFEKIELKMPKELEGNIYIRNIVFDSSDNMWVGTNLGLYIVIAEEVRSGRFGVRQYRYERGNGGSIGYDYILPIIFDKGDNAWVGTLGGGLYRTELGEDGLPTIFVKMTGLLNPFVKSLVCDKSGDIWISTNRGISKYDVEDEILSNYGNRKGTVGGEFGDLASELRRSGRVVFGSRDGLNIIEPTTMMVDNKYPQIYIKGLHIHNELVEVGEQIGGRVLLEREINSYSHITLHSDENHFTIDFIGLHYVNPELNRHRYRLDGFDSDWIEDGVGTREAKYNNMQPGEYTFMVQAANCDGEWGGERQLRITILEPWWNSIYARSAFVALLCILLYALYNYYKVRLQHRNAIALAKVEKQQMNDMSMMQTNFFTNISHEFRTPLSLIIAPVSSLLRSEDLVEGDRKRVRLIDSNAAILLRLINQLLDFSRFNQGRLVVKPDVRDMVPFLRHLLDQFSEYAEMSRVDISLLSECEELICRIDYTMLEHILYNLLSNSMKSSDEGGFVRLELMRDGQNICIKVVDNGCGIPPELQEHLFERFVKGRKGGTGIGLNFTKSLVELNGGDISYQTSDEGTTFSVSFAGVVTELNFELTEVNDEPSLESAEGVVDVDCDGEEQEEGDSIPSMLIVEDNLSLLDYLKDHFSQSYRVITAVNGEAGLNRATTQLPDLVISDVVMPRMCGDEMCRRIKESHTTSHIPVVLLTAKSSPADQAEGYRCGADVYCPKPFDIQVLDVMVRSLIESRAKLQERFKYMDVEVSDLVANNSDEVMINRAIRFIKDNISDCDLTTGQVAEHIKLSQYLLNKKLKALVGVSGNTLIRNIRLKYAADLLLKSDMNISEIIYASGFNSLKYFRSCFAEMYNMTPSDYRRSGK